MSSLSPNPNLVPLLEPMKYSRLRARIVGPPVGIEPVAIWKVLRFVCYNCVV